MAGKPLAVEELLAVDGGLSLQPKWKEEAEGESTILVYIQH